jgi:F1F0 ATPase subunit 2
MVNFGELVIVFLIGIGLGLGYFLGLWWTVRRAMRSRYPHRWLIGSAAVRLVLLLLAFWVLMDGHWENLVAALLGFWVARMLLKHYLKPVREAARRNREMSTGGD